ncbi:MAG TPA: cation:proton antiporter [Ktedonobacteraceae bacterium]|nr:cation:proton antiporter [Ktedonobacteraceae bacterium]
MVDIPLLIRDLVFFLLVALVVNFITAKLSVPYTLGLVIVGLCIGFIGLAQEAKLSPDLVLFVFLPALLFEAGWSANLTLLRENWRAIFFLAGPGLLLSLLIIATAFHFLDQLDWATAFLLAAILSPTDPVAVLGLFRQLHVNERLSTIIEGESLFNDGMAGSLYQIFLALVLLTLHGQAPSGLIALGNGLLLFVLEAGGGLALGILAGFLISRVLRRIDDPVVETTITLLAAYGIYWVADAVHLSAIIAVLVAALLLGNYGRAIGMSERTSTDADTFWRMLAFLGNALIFLLMGVQIHPFAQGLLAGPSLTIWLVILVAIGVVLLARFVLVLVLTIRAWVRLPREKALPFLAPLVKQPLPHSWQLIVFWSGLRGALSLALVLALPQDVPSREILVLSTYAVVLFTLLIQGLSIRWVLQHTHSTSQRIPTGDLQTDEQVFVNPSTEKTQEPL